MGKWTKDGPVKSKETRHGWKRLQKNVLLQKNYGEERLEDYSTSVPWLCNIFRVVFQFFLTQFFCSRLVFLCFNSCLISVLFTGPCIPTCTCSSLLQKFFKPWYMCPFPCEVRASFLECFRWPCCASAFSLSFIRDDRAALRACGLLKIWPDLTKGPYEFSQLLNNSSSLISAVLKLWWSVSLTVVESRLR